MPKNALMGETLQNMHKFEYNSYPFASMNVKDKHDFSSSGLQWSSVIYVVLHLFNFK